jgi:hypothetical protein
MPPPTKKETWVAGKQERLEVLKSYLSYSLLLEGEEGKGAEAYVQRTNARMLE